MSHNGQMKRIHELAAQQEQVQMMQVLRAQDHAREMVKAIANGATLLLAGYSPEERGSESVIGLCAMQATRVLAASEKAFQDMSRAAHAAAEAREKLAKSEPTVKLT